MNTIDLVELGKSFNERYNNPTPLFFDGDHAVYWLGTPEDSAFRCNTYLLRDGNESFLVDPGGRPAFGFIKKRVLQILPPEDVTALIICHQDPEVGASMADLLEVNPRLKIITSVRANVLLPHFGKTDFDFFNINEAPEYTFTSGRKIRFIPSPFLHFPGAFATYDITSGFLFSGDVWAAMDMDWKLVVEDFNYH